MNNKIFTLFVAALLISNVSFAKIFRLGYTGPQVTGTDFTEAQLAHDAASAGDTLLFFPGSYTINVATKKLVYLGYGYNTSGTDGNANLQLLNGACRLAVYLYQGASGSTFEGIESLQAIAYYQENGVNDITIRRCKGTAYVFNSAGTTSNNWQILQCTDMNIIPNWQGGNTTNLRVENSQITQANFAGSTLHTGQFINCVFTGSVSLNNNAMNFQNCVFTTMPSAELSNSLFQYCLFSGEVQGLPGSNNIFNISPSDNAGVNNIFIGYPYEMAGETADSKYKLKTGSPAKGAGMGGIDMGIFGGANPYKLSGIPSIPAFYKLTAPSNNATTNPYTITFSVRSNN